MRLSARVDAIFPTFTAKTTSRDSRFIAKKSLPVSRVNLSRVNLVFLKPEVRPRHNTEPSGKHSNISYSRSNLCTLHGSAEYVPSLLPRQVSAPELGARFAKDKE